MNTAPRCASLVLLLLSLSACAIPHHATTWTQSELYFGMNRMDGSLVTDEQWTAFVDKEVTPRFPSGLTVHATSGQYRDSNGVIQRERSRVLVVLYPASDTAKADDFLKTIARSYVKQFNQESVLRTDSPAEVTFLGEKP